MGLKRAALGAALMACLLTMPVAGRADIPAGLNKFQRSAFVVARDKTYVESQIEERLVVNAGQIADLSTATFTFDPSDETLTVEEAWVQQRTAPASRYPPATSSPAPARRRRPPPASSAPRRPPLSSPPCRWAASSTPNGSTPHQAGRAGLQPHLHPRLDRQHTARDPYRSARRPALAIPRAGGFATRDHTEGGTRILDAFIEVGRVARSEPQMVAPADVGRPSSPPRSPAMRRSARFYAARKRRQGGRNARDQRSGTPHRRHGAGRRCRPRHV